MEENTRKEPVPKGVGSPFFMCTQQALRYLSLREHNRSELRTKLLSKDYDASLVDAVLDGLEDDGSLSERRYVESFVRSSNRRHAEGKSMLMARLAAKGADRQVCLDVLDEMYSNDEYVETLLKQAYAKVVSKGKASTPAEVRQALMKLGFPSNLIRRCMEESRDS